VLKNNRKENLNLYACLLRKYYIGEEDYMFITLCNIDKTELINSWHYALKKIQHDERIKNSSSVTLGAFSMAMKRCNGFENHDQIVKYLFSVFEPSELKLNDENIERRLRYLLAIKTLKSLEKSINFEFKESELENKSKKEEAKLHEALKSEFENLKKIEISKRQKIKKTGISVSLFLVFIGSILGYFAFKHVNKLEKLNTRILEKSLLQKNNLEQKIDGIYKEVNILRDENSRLNNLHENEDYLSQVLNEKKFKNFKQKGFTGNIFFEEIFGYKSITGQLVKGEERGVWVYEKHNGEKEVFKWISSRVGAICRDGNRSYATGRGACSHHGGVDYWLNEYQRVKVSY
jgi:hypothetical protein